MLAIEHYYDDGEPWAEMPLWTVTGCRSSASPGFVRHLRVTIAAPSRLAAIGVARRDDPYWDACDSIKVVQHNETSYAPTRGGFSTLGWSAWEFAPPERKRQILRPLPGKI